ncbi:MAG: hypothetical protein JSW58_06065 [Candidatus Latescibacterota bacterium]|nr:MAG: hypothetical protein JSW58_06065 [Candidatus Latescibacterota bacterium]
MRYRMFVLAILAVVVPALLQGETLYLKDGSALRGKLIRFDNDTLHFETTFGSTVLIPKIKVSRIDFLDAGTGPAPSQPVVGFQSAEPGTLEVIFEEFKLASRISVHRGKDREAHERENAIEQGLWVEDEKVYSWIDSTTDKVIRGGPETILRNDIEPLDFRVGLPPGLHHCKLAFGNVLVSEYVNRFEPRPLEKNLLVDNVQIESGKRTRIRVGLKRGKLKMGVTRLYVIR